MEFTLVHEFEASPEEIFNAWMDSEKHSAMIDGESIIGKEDYSAWNGYITGKNLEIVPFQKIKQSWRTSEFPEEQEDSIIEIELVPIGNSRTKFTLYHYNLSDTDMQYKQGWMDYYFVPMEKYFNIDQ